MQAQHWKRKPDSMQPPKRKSKCVLRLKGGKGLHHCLGKWIRAHAKCAHGHFAQETYSLQAKERKTTPEKETRFCSAKHAHGHFA